MSFGGMRLKTPPDVLYIETKTTSVIKISEDKTNTESFLIVATHCPQTRLQIKQLGFNWIIKERKKEEKEEEEEELECIDGMYHYWMKKPYYCFEMISITGGIHTEVIFDFNVKPALNSLQCDGCKVTFVKIPTIRDLSLKISNGSSVDMGKTYCCSMYLVIGKGVVKNVNILNAIHFDLGNEGVVSNFFVHPCAEIDDETLIREKQWIIGMM